LFARANQELPEDAVSVAIVNGEHISKDAYSTRLSQLSSQYQAQGIDVSSAENSALIEEQVVNNLIDEVLLQQAAKTDGFSVGNEDVENEFNSVAEQFGGIDAFQKTLSEQSISEDTVRNDLRNQILMQQYLETQVDFNAITVTDEAVQETYDAFAAQSPEAPEFETVKDAIREQLVQQALQEKINAFLDQLRAQSDVVVL